jgi:hypothetical protein
MGVLDTSSNIMFNGERSRTQFISAAFSKVKK